MTDRTLLPRAFGLTTPAPLWTAPAFDRCLLLALVYPIAAIFLIWAISNKVGPAEAALGLKSMSDVSRAAVMTAIGFCAFAYWRGTHAKDAPSLRWRTLAYGIIGVVIGASASTGLNPSAVSRVGVGAVAAAAAVAVAVPVLTSGTAVFTGAVVVAIAGVLVIAVANNLAAAVSSAGTDPFLYAIALPVGFVVALASVFAFGVQFLSDKSIERMRQGTFLSLFLIFSLLCCFTGAIFLSSFYTWKDFGPLLLFLGLLTLLNAPFDWLSLGLTRALMRRGLEREKWWPYLYATLDALLAAVIIAFLAIVMVAGVQLFDDLAIYGGGGRVLPPMRQFLDGIKAHSANAEYWWVYATLFSTMVPSLINLFIAGVSLARGVPGVSSWLLGKVREGEAVPAYDRLLVAVVLALQGVGGLVIALAAQGFLFWMIIWQGMPRLGIGVLDLAYIVAR